MSNIFTRIRTTVTGLKRVWSAQNPPVPTTSKSFRFPVRMWEEITRISSEDGEKPNTWVVLVIDQYLQVRHELQEAAATEGELTKPAPGG